MVGRVRVSVASLCLLLMALPAVAVNVSTVGHMAAPIEATAVAVDTSKAYIFGGMQGSPPANTADIHVFDPATGTVSLDVAKLPTPRAFAEATMFGTKAYVFGGIDAGWTAQVVRFDPSTHTVTPAGNLPSGRAKLGLASDGNFIWAFGGQDASGTWLRDIVKYDPATGTATKVATNLPQGLGYPLAVASGPDIYVFGGYLGPPTTKGTNDILRFTPSSGAIVKVGTMSVDLWDSAGFASNGVIYVVGGVADQIPGGTSNAVYTFDTNTHAWTQLPQTIVRPMGGMTAGFFPNLGKAFVFGGNIGNPGTAYDEVEQLDFCLPPTPGTPTATTPASGTTTFSWSAVTLTDPACSLLGYSIMAVAGPGPVPIAAGNLACSAAPAKLTCDFTGLACNTYTFVLVATAGDGSSSQYATGPQSTFTTPCAAPPPPPSTSASSGPAYKRNHSPTLNVPALRVEQGQSGTAVLSASDPDGDDVSWLAIAMPRAAAYDAAAHIVTWDTTNLLPGLHCGAVVAVSDGALSTARDVCVTVTLHGATDTDHDGVDDVADNCNGRANHDQKDVDRDGVGDVCDVCPTVADPTQADADKDGSGDACSGGVAAAQAQPVGPGQDPVQSGGPAQATREPGGLPALPLRPASATTSARAVTAAGVSAEPGAAATSASLSRFVLPGIGLAVLVAGAVVVAVLVLRRK